MINTAPSVLALSATGVIVLLVVLLRLFQPTLWGTSLRLLVSVDRYDPSTYTMSSRLTLSNLLQDLIVLLVLAVYLFRTTVLPAFDALILAALLFWGHIALIFFLASIMLNRAEAGLHMIQHLVFVRMLALLNLPLLLVLLLQTVVPDEQVLLAILIVNSICAIGWLTKMLLELIKLSPETWYYLFLYLCTLEIAPLLYAEYFFR